MTKAGPGGPVAASARPPTTEAGDRPHRPILLPSSSRAACAEPPVQGARITRIWPGNHPRSLVMYLNVKYTPRSAGRIPTGPSRPARPPAVRKGRFRPSSASLADSRLTVSKIPDSPGIHPIRNHHVSNQS